jgi:osmoprotectant transport system permease protein
VTFAELVEWFSTTEDITTKVVEHARLSYLPVLGALVVAGPVGLFVGHRRRFEFLAVTIANLGRAIPSFAIVALALPISIRLGLGLGFWPTFAALFFLAVPPILVNTYIGVRDVDPDVVEAGRGMGLTEGQVLRGVELPLGMPLMVTGLRTAAVQSVATATLAALVAGGGLGDYIRLGFRSGDGAALLGGAILVALMALVTEVALGWIERRVRRERGEEIAPFEEVAQVSRPLGDEVF